MRCGCDSGGGRRPEAVSWSRSLGSGSALQFTADGYGVLDARDFFVFAPQRG
ncbi:hypothetical protein [Streptomyces sp. L2]|uniref:hypothetical protein n=1 Tax=Streptomyces sp. L2 TaxID=2162665 RepID=UPI0013E92961|nr:hypothetical protein [Streptomyces sp. L2]